VLERRLRLPAGNQSPMLARRALRDALQDSELGDLIEDALLLTSELCENAVLHAGTGFELLLTATDTELTIAVTDQGPTAMELNLAKPRPLTDRMATNGRGLVLVDALADAWGTRHDTDGHHVWFTLRRGGTDTAGDPGSATHETEPPATTPPTLTWPNVSTCRWLLHLSNERVATLPLPSVIGELARRLCEVLVAEGVGVWVDFDDGNGEQELASHGQLTEPASIDLPLPLAAPLAGRFRVQLDLPTPSAVEIAELCAQRLALAIESDWLRGADRRRWSWMTYLAETSELLAHSLDVELTAAIVPQIVVPRIGQWCAVHLLDGHGQLDLAALTHTDETELPELRKGLDTAQSDQLRSQLDGVLRGGGAAPINVPGDGIAVALTARGQALGTVTVGRLADRAHNPEEIMVISDVARRAAPAIDNAQRNATSVETSQALQQALLPRALPDSDGVDFAAAYLPATTGADVGGDFYDVVPVSPGRWLVSIGDVCGKGARAAARTGQVREVVRVLVREGHPPARVLELLNDVMMEAQDPHQFCTVALAMVTEPPAGQPGGLSVELVLAGHDQPVLVHADGGAELVGRHGTAAGLVSDFTVYPTHHVLVPGDVLVTYTDGITERRRGREEFGHDRLVSTIARAAGLNAAGVVSMLRVAVDEFSNAGQRDDIAVMAIGAPAT